MAAKNEDLALIPGTHRVEGEPAPASYSLTPTCAPWHICLYTHKHKEIITFTKKKKRLPGPHMYSCKFRLNVFGFHTISLQMAETSP